jgi:YHS domain-containing protein
VKLSTGAELSADAAYVRESIVAPDAKVVAGHVLRMPAYGEDLAPGELDALVAHVLAMKVPRPTTVAPKPSATASAMAGTDDGVSDAAAPSGSADANDANATEPAAIAVDPVCSMNVGVGQDTPRAEHAGRTLYFCSGLCRERFVADPERYTKTPTPP